MKRFSTEPASAPARASGVPAAQGPPASHLSSADRMLAFMDLVNQQDAGGSVAASRAAVMAKYRVDERELAAIEAEGLKNDWAPL